MKLITRPLTADLRVSLRAIPKVNSPFKADYSSTLRLLDTEVGHLARRDTDPVLMIDIEERMLRLDGSLRADARPASADVAIAVETRNGSLIFPCGRFTGWQDNVRAIALGMEALRKVDRYGISPNAEQYRGYRAIGSGTAMPPASPMTVKEAETFIVGLMDVCEIHPGGKPADVGTVRRDLTGCYRVLARRLHPDAGGDPDLFHKLTEARDLLLAAS